MNPVEVRENVRTMFEELGMTASQAKDLEIGIYNKVIDLAVKSKTPRNWSCPVFYDLYMAKARNMYANINPSEYIQNKTLIEKIIKKECIPHELPFMDNQELYPEVWADLLKNEEKRKNLQTELRRAQETDMFTCGKCKKNKTSYYEMQTRSADEPSTIFVSCLTCGNRWRMG